MNKHILGYIAAVLLLASAVAFAQPIGTTSPNQPITSPDLGTQADSTCGSAGGTCSLIALTKYSNATPPVLGAGTARVGYTSDDACNNANTKTFTAVNVVTATNVIIAGVSAKNKYICAIFLYPAGTTNIAVYQATTGTSCATAQTAIFGGTTTATGFIATAQAGFVVGTGNASVAKTTTVNTDICVTTSAAIQVSGVVVTADQ